MTNKEIVKMIRLISIAYPKYYVNLENKESELLELYQIHFSEENAYVVNLALKNIIATKTFPPAIADIKNEIQHIKLVAKADLKRHEDATKGVLTVIYTDIITGKTVKEKITNGEQPLDEKQLEEIKEILK